MGSRSHKLKKRKLSKYGVTIAGRERKGGRKQHRSGNTDPYHDELRKRFIEAHPGAIKSRAQIMGVNALSKRELRRRSSFPFVGQ